MKIKHTLAALSVAALTMAGTGFAADGQEVPMLNVGDGVRVTVKDANGLKRSVAISIRQKPCRPTPVSSDQESLPEGSVCGLQLPSENVPPPVGEDDWGWNNTSTKVS